MAKYFGLVQASFNLEVEAETHEEAIDKIGEIVRAEGLTAAKPFLGLPAIDIDATEPGEWGV